MFAVVNGRFEEKAGATWLAGVVNVLFAETVGFGQGTVSVDDVVLMLEIRGSVHEDLDGFFATCGIDNNFVERIGQRGIFGGDFEKTLFVHDEDKAEATRFEDWGEEVGDVDGAGAFFEKEVGVVEAEDDVFGGVGFVHDFGEEIFKVALILGGGNEAGNIEGVNLVVLEVGGNI